MALWCRTGRSRDPTEPKVRGSNPLGRASNPAGNGGFSCSSRSPEKGPELCIRLGLRLSHRSGQQLDPRRFAGRRRRGRGRPRGPDTPCAAARPRVAVDARAVRRACAGASFSSRESDGRRGILLSSRANAQAARGGPASLIRVAVRRILPYHESSTSMPRARSIRECSGLEEGTSAAATSVSDPVRRRVLFGPPKVKPVLPQMGVDVGSREAVDVAQAQAVQDGPHLRIPRGLPHHGRRHGREPFQRDGLLDRPATSLPDVSSAAATVEGSFGDMRRYQDACRRRARVGPGPDGAVGPAPCVGLRVHDERGFPAPPSGRGGGAVRHGASPAAQRDRPVPVQVVDDRLRRRVRRLRAPRRGAGAGVALDGAGGARGRARAARGRGRALVRLPPRAQGVGGRRPDGCRPGLPRTDGRRQFGPGVGRVLGRGDARLRERAGRHRHGADPLSPRDRGHPIATA